MGARAVLAAVMNSRNPKQDSVSRWARRLAERRGHWRAVVAIAAKHTRMAALAGATPTFGSYAAKTST
jgi:transposase